MLDALRLTRLIATAAGLLLMGSYAVIAPAQDGNVSVFVRLKDGFLAVDEAKTKPQLSAFPKPEAVLRTQLIADVNRVFRSLGRLCTQAFDLSPGADCPAEAAPVAQLTTNTWDEAKSQWEAWQSADRDKRKSLASVFNLGSAAIVLLEEQLPLQSGLSFDSSDVAALDFGSGMLTFQLTPPVTGQEPVTVADAGEGVRLASEAQIQAALKRLAGGFWRKPEIELSIASVYPENRVVQRLGAADTLVGFRVKASTSVEEHVVQVQEGIRLTDIQMAPSIGDILALRAYYYLIPHKDLLALANLRAVTYPSGSRPLITPDMVERLAAFKSLGLTFGLIPDPSATLQSMRILKTDDPPPQGSAVAESSSALPGWVRLEFGLQYRPGQGVRFVARPSLINMGGAPQTAQFEVGGANAGALGGLQYSRDFLFFGDLRRRLSVAVNGDSNMDTKRILSGMLTNERRWSATARADLEWIPDRDGRLASFYAEAERTTVVLERPDVPNTSVLLAVLNGGGSWKWSRTGLGLGRQVSLDPRIRLGIPITKNYAGFQLFSATAAFRQELPKLWEARITLRAAGSSSGTPQVEQPVLGGADSVRGFRTDTAIGRRAWSVQNEIWAPLGIPRTTNAALEMLRSMRVAGFFDAGGIHHVSEGEPGLLYGVGGGLRIKVARTVFLKLDYGRGFGVQPGTRKGRFYLGADAAF